MTASPQPMSERFETVVTSAHGNILIAEADVLGIFGREGVYLANIWEQAGGDMIYAGMRTFTAYDGKDGKFGDTSVRATSSDTTKTSVYASIDADNPSRVVLVAINKTGAPLNAGIALAAYGNYTAADVYQLTAGTGATMARSTAWTAS